MSVQMDEENEKQDVLSAPEDKDVDWKKLYHREVQNAKQQRQKKQDVEARLDTIEQSRDDARKKKLEEDGNYKVIISELEESNKSLVTEVKGYRVTAEAEKISLINKFPEDEQTNLTNMDLETLKYLDQKINAQAVINPPEAPGTISSKEYKLEDIDKMPPKERAEAWKTIQAQYAKKSSVTRSILVKFVCSSSGNLLIRLIFSASAVTR